MYGLSVVSPPCKLYKFTPDGASINLRDHDIQLINDVPMVTAKVLALL